MHRTLWLVRHATAADPVSGQPDDQRPLAPCGVAEVSSLLRHLVEEQATPAQWLWLSPALRTRQTAAPITNLWQCEAVEDASLYLSDAFALLNCLQTTLSDYQHAALVGHNPGISQLAHYLAAPSDRNIIDADLPPLGAVHFALRGNWHDLGLGACSVKRYLTPNQLPADR